MYRYDQYDQRIVDQRVAQFRDQTERYLAGSLTDDEFRPLRLQNGLYIQRHAPMLRVAIPYGLLSSRQMRKLADIAERYDRGYGHFTTRQNIQYNWPKLAEVPAILAELASVEMHAIQTSGNCVRNVTTDHFAGVAADEIIDPRPYCELIRQWSTFNPEFAYLPRKFKIAVSGTSDDRAATMVHDIGVHAVFADDGAIGFRIIVGGGLGRTPIIGSVVREYLPRQHLLSYLDAILRVYNRYGRRDNIHKARIKILVKQLGVAEFTRQVEDEWLHLKDQYSTVTDEEFARIATHFVDPAYATLPARDARFETKLGSDRKFAAWVRRNVHSHKVPGYAAVTLSLKPTGVPPGDATTAQMFGAADLADEYSFGELRVSHEQNLILADVPQWRLYELWQAAGALGLATPNIGLLTDIIACPGGDFCSLANARSIPVAEAIQRHFDDFDYVYDVGDIDVHISGCMNGCAQHYIAHIGVLGVDKNGAEFYQVTIGGSQGERAELGKVIGPSFSAEEVPGVFGKLLNTYVARREDGERFIDTVRRLGVEPFKDSVYGPHS
jgi:sulfite reductase (NADPH) hemoprotein beta-component